MKEVHSKEWLPVKKLPSQVHLDLLANNMYVCVPHIAITSPFPQRKAPYRSTTPKKLTNPISPRISDPFLNTNELPAKSIASKSWLYRLSLPTPPQTTKSTDLVFSGLDTFATVILNGKVILQTSNMHLSHRVPITLLLNQNGAPNVLEITFDSALLQGRELVKAHAEHQHFARQTEDSRIPVRKAQYHWGWDWGPILVTAGPWRPVWLEMYDVRVEDVWVRYALADGLEACSGRIFARMVGVTEGTEVRLCLSSWGGIVVFEAVARTDGEGLAEAAFSIEDAKLWYPLGYGPQHRYELSAKVHSNGIVSASSSKLIGFRTCELVQEPDDNGRSFYFRINGVDIFCGGSCWIPGDSFLSEITPERYYDWIKLLAASNQIMIRVWGGGIYEDDAFFDVCDELGILVWHDFAFACGNYPVYASFLVSVEREVRQNVRRTRSHPSLVIWAGNNEDYQVLERYKLEYDPKSRDPEAWLKTTFPARYTYEYFLPKLLEEEAPGTLYHPGSPWGDHRHSADPSVGDIHQWDSKSLTIANPDSCLEEPH
jgi:beta-mannosidase